MDRARIHHPSSNGGYCRLHLGEQLGCRLAAAASVPTHCHCLVHRRRLMDFHWLGVHQLVYSNQSDRSTYFVFSEGK